MVCKYLKSYRKDGSEPRWCLKNGLKNRKIVDSKTLEFCKDGKQFCYEEGK